MNGNVGATPEPADLGLAAGFPVATRARWREMVAGVLRRSGVDASGHTAAPERLLASTSYDGIVIDPLYDTPAADPGFPGLAPFTRGDRPQGAVPDGWDVRQAHAGPDATAAREAVLADLENGVTSLWIIAGEAGIPVPEIGAVLDAVDLAAVPVTLEAGTDTDAARVAEALLRAHAERGTPDSQVRGNLGLDPLTVAARTGETADLPARVTGAARHAAGVAARFPQLRTMVVDATPYHEAGGSEAQELGAAMATGLTYLRALVAAEVDGPGAGDLQRAAAQLEFRFSASADQFLTIAKLRAARAMWNRVGEVCGLAEPYRAMRQHAVTSGAMMTRRDPYVNVLRATVACFAAAVGGADAITVRPFDHALGVPNARARRLARNTQSLLRDEAGVAHVIDPAGGSGYVESLTSELVAAGWRVLQEVEAAGGAPAALTSGMLPELVEETWRRRRENLAHRRDPLTGVSEFPDLAEPLESREPAPATARPGALLPPRRYAEEYESLRDRSDAHLAATGTRPRVFLAALGPVAAHNARVTFAANLFRAGGVEPVPSGPVETPEEAARAFTASGAAIACLCSDDGRYAEHGEPVSAALRAAGARRVLLAGPPRGQNTEVGVDGYLYAGCDALALLEDVCATLEVAR